MKLLLNILWFITGGFLLAAGYILFGIIACLLVITYVPALSLSLRDLIYR